MTVGRLIDFEKVSMSAHPVHGLSVVIPTLNSAGQLARTLAGLEGGRAQGLLDDIIISDGGSRDDTLAIAEGAGARVVRSAAGRGQQLGAGADAAKGLWLLFLHDDSRLDEGWIPAVQDFIVAQDGQMSEQAAVFAFALDDPDPRARRIERLARWRGRRLGLPYGDQGLLISRAHYEQLGGFRPLPLMEDVDLVRRIGRGRLATLPCHLYTSAARYRRDGWVLRPLRNLTLLGLYFLGLSPDWLRRLYG